MQFSSNHVLSFSFSIINVLYLTHTHTHTHTHTPLRTICYPVTNKEGAIESPNSRRKIRVQTKKDFWNHHTHTHLEGLLKGTNWFEWLFMRQWGYDRFVVFNLSDNCIAQNRQPIITTIIVISIVIENKSIVFFAFINSISNTWQFSPKKNRLRRAQLKHFVLLFQIILWWLTFFS